MQRNDNTKPRNNNDRYCRNLLRHYGLITDRLYNRQAETGNSIETRQLMNWQR